MANTAAWGSLEKPLNPIILDVIANEFKFTKMTPVQVCFFLFSVLIPSRNNLFIVYCRKQQYRCYCRTKM